MCVHLLDLGFSTSQKLRFGTTWPGTIREETSMHLQRLVPVLLVFASAMPVDAQPRMQHEVDSVLQGASVSLENYREIARRINCDDATGQTFRDSCKETLDMLGKDVKEADEKIMRYRQVSNPQAVDLFDIYEVFHKIMEGVETLGATQEFYGEHNRQSFAQAYNNLVKLTGWLGSVVREAIRATPKCS